MFLLIYFNLIIILKYGCVIPIQIYDIFIDQIIKCKFIVLRFIDRRYTHRCLHKYASFMQSIIYSFDGTKFNI